MRKKTTMNKEVAKLVIAWRVFLIVCFALWAEVLSLITRKPYFVVGNQKGGLNLGTARKLHELNTHFFRKDGKFSKYLYYTFNTNYDCYLFSVYFTGLNKFNKKSIPSSSKIIKAFLKVNI